MTVRRHPIDRVMASGDKGQQGGQPGAQKGDKARAARLRKALRENLKRRKLQVRGRAGTGSPSHDSAGFVPDKSED
jgi:hypothetical protein